MYLEEKIGESLFRFKAIEKYQIEIILTRQDCGDKRKFGEIAVDLHYINKESLNSCLRASDLPLWSIENRSVGTIKRTLKDNLQDIS